MVYSSQPQVRPVHLIIQQMYLPKARLGIIEVAPTTSKTYYNDPKIMH